MSATIATVRATLIETFARLDSRCAQSAEQLLKRPSCLDAWSAAEHLEHVSLVNHFLLLTIGKGTAAALRRSRSQPIPAGESDLAHLDPVADPHSFPWEPPGHMIPTGTKPTAEVRELLNSQLGECLLFLEQMGEGEGRLCSFRMSVYNLGRLDMYQWLYFLAQHGRWHMAFLAERESAARQE